MNHTDLNDGRSREEQAAAMAQAPQQATSVDLDSCMAQLSEAQRQADDFKNRYLRTAAEVENTRKQAERDAMARATQEKRRFLREFLEVADTLEVALSLGDWPGMREGVKLAYQQLQQVLARAGVTRIEVKTGDTFDPVYHEAVDVRAGDSPNDIVVEVVRAGYLHDGELLRPAQVIVARGRQQ
jgi:molecular chaperone GrpE